MAISHYIKGMKEILRKLREVNRLSQASVAEYLGISRQMYMKYEAGENEPTVKVVKSLSQLYHVSCDVIINNQIPVTHKSGSNEYIIADEYSEVASPAPQYSAGKTVAESPLDMMMLRKFSFLSEEHKTIVGNLVDSLLDMRPESKDRSGHCREPGGLTGKFYMAPDFDETPDCFREYM